MSRRRNIVHAALISPPCFTNRDGRRPVAGSLEAAPIVAFFERVGIGEPVDLAFVTACRSSSSLRIDKDELSLRKRQRARFRHQAADMNPGDRAISRPDLCSLA